jgi:hypothetical protein
VVFVSVIAWGWLWGVAGALMAVPIVTALKVVCHYFPPLEYAEKFLRNERAIELSNSLERGRGLGARFRRRGRAPLVEPTRRP